MLAFAGPVPTGCNVNHKDGDKLNPHLDNLEYCTFAENSQHAIRTGLFVPSGRRRGSKASHAYNVGANNPNSRLTAEVIQVIKARLDGGESASRIAPDFGVSKWAIYNVKYQRRWV